MIRWISASILRRRSIAGLIRRLRCIWRKKTWPRTGRESIQMKRRRARRPLYQVGTRARRPWYDRNNDGPGFAPIVAVHPAQADGDAVAGVDHHSHLRSTALYRCLSLPARIAQESLGDSIAQSKQPPYHTDRTCGALYGREHDGYRLGGVSAFYRRNPGGAGGQSDSQASASFFSIGAHFDFHLVRFRLDQFLF